MSRMKNAAVGVNSGEAVEILVDQRPRRSVALQHSEWRDALRRVRLVFNGLRT
jgi:hypothetical protein